jgi:hypothetical protein
MSANDNENPIKKWSKAPLMVEGRLQEYADLATLGEMENAPPLLRRHRCEIGDYPWDRWEKRAIAAGVKDGLAQLGREVMREADQHSWDADLQADCGWPDVEGAAGDEGDRMIARAIEEPAACRRRWRELLDSDGGRGTYWNQGAGSPMTDDETYTNYLRYYTLIGIDNVDELSTDIFDDGAVTGRELAARALASAHVQVVKRAPMSLAEFSAELARMLPEET